MGGKPPMGDLSRSIPVIRSPALPGAKVSEGPNQSNFYQREEEKVHVNKVTLPLHNPPSFVRPTLNR